MNLTILPTSVIMIVTLFVISCNETNTEEDITSGSDYSINSEEKTVSSDDIYNNTIAEITKAISTSLASKENRYYLKKKLDLSQNSENIAFLDNLLFGNEVEEAKGFLGSVMGKLRITSSDLSSMVTNLEYETDVYMPVSEHRKKWNGQSEILVVYVPAGIDDNDMDFINGYTHDGMEIQLNGDEAPEQPTLVIIPCEHDGYHTEKQIQVGNGKEDLSFNDFVKRDAPDNINSENKPNSSNKITGAKAEKLGFIYLEEFVLQDQAPYEPWWMGNMEIEFLLEHKLLPSGNTEWIFCNYPNNVCRYFTNIIKYQHYFPCEDNYVLLDHQWSNCQDVSFHHEGFDAINIHVYEDDYNTGCYLTEYDDLIHIFEDISIVTDGWLGSGTDIWIRIKTVPVGGTPLTPPSCGTKPPPVES